MGKNQQITKKMMEESRASLELNVEMCSDRKDRRLRNGKIFLVVIVGCPFKQKRLIFTFKAAYSVTMNSFRKKKFSF